MSSHLDHIAQPPQLLDGGFIVFNYGDPSALAVQPGISRIMFDAFGKLMYASAVNPRR